MSASLATVAIFGGSFNPPHLAHQLAVLSVLETHAVDAVWIVPTFHHAFDKHLAPFDDRLAMVRAAMQPFAGRAEVSTIERDRDDGTGRPSRTLDTLTALAARQPGTAFRLVIGTDILGERDKWYRWADVERLAPPIILGRQGVVTPPELAPLIELPAISSTEVRARVARGASIAHLVPRSVAAFIAAKGLYEA